MIYYGTEASTNPNNPCKVATIRKCAEVTEKIFDKSDYSIIKMEMADNSGRIIFSDQQQVVATPDEIIQMRLASLADNVEFNIIKR